MSNRDSRKLLQEQAEIAEWCRVQQQPRPLNQRILIRGIGVRRLRLMVCPSFEDRFAWDVRTGPQGWCLYRSTVIQEPFDDPHLLGYVSLQVSPDLLQSFFNRLTTIQISLAPDVSGGGGLDGTLYHLDICGDLYSSCTFRWWSEFPEHWKSIVEIADEMLAVFSQCRPIKEPL